MLSIIRASGGEQWWQHSYNIIGKDVGNYLAMRLVEIGDSVPPWYQMLPYMQATAHGHLDGPV